MRHFILAVLIPCSVFAQTLVNSFAIDTSKYTTNIYVSEQDLMGNSDAPCMKKDSSAIDIYNYLGTMVSFNIPRSWNQSKYILEFFIYKGFITNDSAWAFVIDEIDSSRVDSALTLSASFKVYNINGTLLLSGQGGGNFGTDGVRTYFIAENAYVNPATYKVWVFRTNIGAVLPGAAKQRAGVAAPSYSIAPSGALRVNFQPLGNGKTSIQLFDMVGRTVYAGIVPTTAGAPSSFTIPAANVPVSPFVAKISSGGAAVSEKIIPMR